MKKVLRFLLRLIASVSAPILCLLPAAFAVPPAETGDSSFQVRILAFTAIL